MSYLPDHWHTIQQRLSENGVDSQHYVVIQPTARQMFKCWDEEKFSEVIDSLESRGYSVVLTSGPSAADIACVTKIKEHCKIKPVTALAGKTSFPELAALIDHASLFIGVDSAPMHIAAALKTPIVCLLAPRITGSGVRGVIISLCFGRVTTNQCLRETIWIAIASIYPASLQATLLGLQKSF